MENKVGINSTLNNLEEKLNIKSYTGQNGNYVSVEAKTTAEYFKQESIAENMYEQFRTTSDDIPIISNNTGWSVEEIKQVKNHVFLRKLRLDNGERLLDADYEMANAWQRLIDGDFYENDILLLKHELYESTYYDLYNCSQREAHDATSKLYDWASTVYKK